MEAYAKKSRRVCQAGKLWEEDKQMRPPSLRQARAHALLGPLPSRVCLPQLGRTRVSEPDELFAAVGAGTDSHPAGVDQGAKVTGQGCLVQRCQAAEISLPYFAGAFKVPKK